ncbi:MAG: P63C domain-containing protein [Bacteroidetes bacterium]|nr:P63C domain-containing protein [Bacteroidota bacterium]
MNSKHKKTELPKATHSGEINIDGFKFKCYNLETGERVLSREGLLRALGRTGKPKYKEELSTEGDNQVFTTPLFLSAKNLKPFISNSLLASSQTIVFETNGGQKLYGYNADILPSVCYVFLDAAKQNVLTTNQKAIAERCELLVRGFATVGIIALIDEATGYQYNRERDELQKILKAYISEELLPWQKKFPDIFYKELFRLNGWDFTVNGIKKRPGVIGTWTNKLVYEQLPQGVLKELKTVTPKSEAGNYTARFFQSLTPDTGNPHLTAQIQQIITLFQLSDTMEHMWAQFAKLKQRQMGQIEIPFQFDEKGHTKEPAQKLENLSDFNIKLSKALDYNPKDKKEE